MQQMTQENNLIDNIFFETCKEETKEKIFFLKYQIPLVVVFITLFFFFCFDNEQNGHEKCHQLWWESLSAGIAYSILFSFQCFYLMKSCFQQNYDKLQQKYNQILDSVILIKQIIFTLLYITLAITICFRDQRENCGNLYIFVLCYCISVASLQAIIALYRLFFYGK